MASSHFGLNCPYRVKEIPSNPKVEVTPSKVDVLVIKELQESSLEENELRIISYSNLSLDDTALQIV
jgi:hypothetical protein